MRFDILESNSNGDWDKAMWVGGDWTGVVCLDWEDSVGFVETMDLGLWYHVRFWSLKVVINGGKTVIESGERERERFLKNEENRLYKLKFNTLYRALIYEAWEYIKSRTF